MNELDNRGEAYMGGSAALQGAGSQQHKERSQALAAGIHNVMAHVLDHLHIRVELIDDELVDLFELAGDGGADLLH